MNNTMIWWQGVVEDRLDPLKLGRCRVRILGYHTDNKEEGVGIPTDHLPWATPSQPITSAAMNGIGTTPMGPVEGTWVFGFFRDGNNAQEPVMLGTFGGIPEGIGDDKTKSPIDVSKGFNDPNGKYPLTNFLNEADTNRLARGIGSLPVPTKGSLNPKKGAEDAPSLDWKRKTRTTSVPTAVAGDISDSIPNSGNFYDVIKWNEPNPRYGGTGDSSTEYLSSVKRTSRYPHNHVRMSECGHVEEWDDSPTAERLHKFHKSGTFEEIQPDGTKVVKVVGNGYEIVAGDKNVQIRGACNVTVSGDCRMLFEKSLVQEVRGDYHLNVHGDMRTKIVGNDVKEIQKGDKKTAVIGGHNDLFVGKNDILNVGIDQNISISGKKTETVTKEVTNIYFDSWTNLTGGNQSMFSAGNIDISTLLNLGLSSVLNYSRTTFGTSIETTTLAHTETCLGGRIEVTTGLSSVTAGVWSNVSGIITLN